MRKNAFHSSNEEKKNATESESLSDSMLLNDDSYALNPLDYPINDEDIKRTLAVIPCYNEEHAIGSIILKTKRFVDEVVVVDDGSSDNTKELARLAGATVLSHQENLGKSAGVKTGFQYALDNDFDYVVTLDGDGQHNPDEIPLVLGKLLTSADPIDISIGTRHGADTEMPLWRKVGKRALDYATSFGDQHVLTDSQSGFRAFNKKAVQGITPRLKGRGFSTESEQILLAGDLGLSITNTHITCKYKSLGSAEATSTKRPTSHGFSVLGYVLWMVAEKRPLLFIGVPGFVMVLFSLFWAILTLQWYNNTGVFLISYALITGVLLMVGALGLFMGLLLNTIPHIIRRTLYEKEYDAYARNQTDMKRP